MATTALCAQTGSILKILGNVAPAESTQNDLQRFLIELATVLGRWVDE